MFMCMYSWREDAIYTSVSRCVSFPYTLLQTGTEVTCPTYAKRLFIRYKTWLWWSIHWPREIHVCFHVFYTVLFC